MGKAPRRYPFETSVILAACLLCISTSLPAEAPSVEASGDAALTEDGTALSPFSRWNTDTSAGDSDLSPSSTADADPSKSKDSTPQSATAGPSHNESSHVAWGPLLGEAFLFATMENAQRVFCEIDTGPELKGILLGDYFKSIANIHGWDDWDPMRVQYFGHSFEGAVSERLEIQNDPLGKYREIGTPGYWKSVLRAFLFAAAYGTSFKVGPYSEAMIGNVGLPNEYRKRPLPKGADYGKMAWSEFLVNPIGGTLWVTTEDLLDRYVIGKEEQAESSLVLRRFSQTFLLPSRSFANILRFKKPWYGEDRPITPTYAAQVTGSADPPDPAPSVWREVGRLELFTGYSFLHASAGSKGYSLNGWEGSATRNLTPWFGLEADFNGLYGSGPASIPSYLPRYTFLFGPHVSFRKITRVTPFVHWLWGGARGPTRTYASTCVDGSSCTVTTSSDTFLAGDVGGGVDIKVGPRFSVRAMEADYLYDNFRPGQGHAQISTGMVFNLRRHER